MGQNRMAERLPGRRGKFDTVLFKTDDDRLRRALKHLGGTECEEGTPVYFTGPEPKVVPLNAADKKPVFLTAENFHRVHELQQHSGTVKVNFSEENVRPVSPPGSRKVGWILGGNGGESHFVSQTALASVGLDPGKGCKKENRVFFHPKKGRRPQIAQNPSMHRCKQLG